jgi:hypothetical protein
MSDAEQQRSPSGEQALRSASQISGLEALRRHALHLVERSGPGWYRHSTVALPPQTHARLLHYNALYQQIVPVPGMVLEFGVQWGASLSQLIALRSVYEPFNLSRRVVGFDTFAGFPSVDVRDGPLVKVGDYSSEEGFRKSLESILDALEQQAPCSELRRFELVEGDVLHTIGPWMEANPHALVAMAIFDMDVYLPTKHAMEHVIPRLTKGSILVFDELCHPGFPGETVAVQEVLRGYGVKLRRSPLQPYSSWCVWGD